MSVNSIAVDIANENIRITAKISCLIAVTTIKSTAVRRTVFNCNSNRCKFSLRQFYMFKELFLEYIINFSWVTSCALRNSFIFSPIFNIAFTPNIYSKALSDYSINHSSPNVYNITVYPYATTG